MPALHISPTQMTAFEAARFEDFRALMVKHLRDTIGGPFAHQTTEALLSYIDKGVTRAKSYGATQNDAFGMFITLMTELGDDFDANSTYPWAQKTLKDTAVTDPNQRIANLGAQCSFYLSNLDNEPEQTTRSKT